MRVNFWHDQRIVSQERLTRHEISWLLAQEARGAARALREGVTQMRQTPGTETRIVNAPSEAPAVETTLDALDDAISMLSELNTGARGAIKPRRGRIDLNTSVDIQLEAGVPLEATLAPRPAGSRPERAFHAIGAASERQRTQGQP